MINGNMIGGTAPIKTLKIIDDDNNEFLGVVTGSEVVFDATPADVRINKTFAGDNGVQIGKNTITYHTTTSSRLILPGQSCSIPLDNYDLYDYTKFQGIIVLFNSDYSSNTNTVGITIENIVFSAETSEKLSDITKNLNTKSIDLNITNDSDNVYEIFYFTYREDTEE